MEEIKKGDIIAEEYEIINLLSQGSFGKVYFGRSLSQQIEVAIKVEKNEVAHLNSLQKEVTILKQLEGIAQIPNVYWNGYYKGMDVIILNMLGKDLIYYFHKFKHFSYQCVCNIAIQMIEILELIHKRNIIHRDLKPENILGSPDSSKIYLIDFGIAKDLEQNKKSKDKLSFIGTTRYASLAAHLGVEQNKKDDLESLGYILIFFINQTLPWTNIDKEDVFRIEKIGQMKEEITLETLCKGLPSAILKYMKYVKQLQHKQKPDYQSLKNLFINENQIGNCLVFDWNKKEFQELKLKSSKSLRSLNNIQISKSSFNNKNKKQFQSISNIKRESYGKIQSKNNHNTFGQKESSDERSNSIKQVSNQKSIFVDYSISYEQTKVSKVSQFRQKSSKSIFGKKHQKSQQLKESSIIPIQSEQQLYELEESDLEIKYNLLHYTSVFYNYKNPIQEFKVIQFS
ncbi:unnamed protein product (macronuclear) [Paramecium tetraurelia]|uniref:Casein kinase I n=1 Tax=Paramecium tetraurelia TaxID=5888 RepID=A0D7F4_PARTE|nr:uncharacterized protein GSPATT00002013001 [Paramecium tetraurelia]CAK78971.1 unnamed protein product [Paramecium tetraurelia]|eukprot:XP_001446368.1 hypothetical protein (macronuclear) [Paramecium tetraurelia strain d4-2]